VSTETEITRGAMVVLTREASASVLGRDSHDGPHLVGLVMEMLDPDFEGDRVWGALVNGEFHQILDREIQEVVLAEAAVAV
jgi:hypothetical protein